MKTQGKLAAAVMPFTVCAACYVTPIPSAHAQGSLTPPGAPAPTMKTLAQVEPRTPISSAPFTISQPGSYYLTANLTVTGGDGITIAADAVTLDLNGFRIRSTAPTATGYGIYLNGGRRNITIANGFVEGGVVVSGTSFSGPGFGSGINYSGSQPVNVLVSRVSVSGCLYYGIYLNTGESTVVDSCTVRTVGSYGIYASTVKLSSATECGNYAIWGDQVSDCRGEAIGPSAGLGIRANSTAENCYGSSTANGTGVVADTAKNCYGLSSMNRGVSASVAQNCYGESYSGTAIYATTALNCVGFSTSGWGMSTDTAQNCRAYGGAGLNAISAQNCYGIGVGAQGAGILADTAQNCYGYSSSSYGLRAYQTASGCYGYSSSGTGLSAFIAHVCHGATSSGTALSTSHNINSY